MYASRYGRAQIIVAILPIKGRNELGKPRKTKRRNPTHHRNRTHKGSKDKTDMPTLTTQSKIPQSRQEPVTRISPTDITTVVKLNTPPSQANPSTSALTSLRHRHELQQGLQRNAVYLHNQLDKVKRRITTDKLQFTEIIAEINRRSLPRQNPPPLNSIFKHSRGQEPE